MPVSSRFFSMEGVKPFILEVAVGHRIPSCGQQGRPICRYILYCRRNKSLRHSREIQRCGLKGMIFRTVYMEVPLCKNLDSQRRPNPPSLNANSMPKKSGASDSAVFFEKWICIYSVFTTAPFRGLSPLRATTRQKRGKS